MIVRRRATRPSADSSAKQARRRPGICASRTSAAGWRGTSSHCSRTPDDAADINKSTMTEAVRYRLTHRLHDVTRSSDKARRHQDARRAAIGMRSIRNAASCRRARGDGRRRSLTLKSCPTCQKVECRTGTSRAERDGGNPQSARAKYVEQFGTERERGIGDDDDALSLDARGG